LAGTLVLVVDSIDLMEPADLASSLAFLPPTLPKQCRMLLSASGQVLRS
jgi:hypothetical protein